MADTARILDALNKLDKTNDAHWTSDGLPRLDTVKFMCGDQSLSREDVSKAAPGFSRTTATEQAPQGAEQGAESTEAATGAQGEGQESQQSEPQGEQSQVQSAATSPESGPSPEEGLQAGTNTEATNNHGTDEKEEVELDVDLDDENVTVADIQAVLDQERKVLAGIEEDLRHVTKRRDAQVAYVDELITMLAEAQPKNGTDAVRGYLDSQRRQNEQRAARAAELVAHGVPPKDAAKIAKANG